VKEGPRRFAEYDIRFTSFFCYPPYSFFLAIIRRIAGAHIFCREAVRCKSQLYYSMFWARCRSCFSNFCSSTYLHALSTRKWSPCNCHILLLNGSKLIDTTFLFGTIHRTKVTVNSRCSIRVYFNAFLFLKYVNFVRS